MRIALVSPNKNSFSETFIRAHLEYLEGQIFYYFSGEIPTEVEGGVVINSRKRRFLDLIKGHFKLNKFSLAEQAVITSFRRNKVNLVFAEYGNTGERLVPICKKLNLPLIVHFHGFDAFENGVIKMNSNYKRLFDYATFVVVVSKLMCDHLKKMGCPEDKLILNTYGPRPEFLKIPFSEKGQQFIALGRFVDKKAPYYLILSFIQVLKIFPRAKLILAGTGDLWNTCKNLVSYYGLENNVKLPGIITRAEFEYYISNSLALVQHSITAKNGDSEGTPVSILEASAAGLPVLSTYHGGIPDVVQNGITGLLVKEHDVKGMADNMIRLLSDPDYAKELGRNGRDNIKNNFTLERHIAVLNDLIKQAVEEKIKNKS